MTAFPLQEKSTIKQSEHSRLSLSVVIVDRFPLAKRFGVLIVFNGIMCTFNVKLHPLKIGRDLELGSVRIATRDRILLHA